MTYDFVSELKRVGALKQGHFVLASGRHSDQYVEKFDLLRQPRATEAACAALVAKLGDYTDVDLVVGPTTGGILLAFEIGRQLGLPAAYAERLDEGSTARGFKRGTQIEPGSSVLVVDDVMTTGGSISATLNAVAKIDARAVAVAILVDRSGSNVDFGVPTISLASFDISTWAADEVPPWLAEIPINKPGTTAAPGRG
jgi:orotate phosphoribosyltransferase